MFDSRVEQNHSLNKLNKSYFTSLLLTQSHNDITTRHRVIKIFDIHRAHYKQRYDISIIVKHHRSFLYIVQPNIAPPPPLMGCRSWSSEVTHPIIGIANKSSRVRDSACPLQTALSKSSGQLSLLSSAEIRNHKLGLNRVWRNF